MPHLYSFRYLIGWNILLRGMAMDDYEELLKYYELQETVGTGMLTVAFK